jgi:hypothetical protein
MPDHFKQVRPRAGIKPALTVHRVAVPYINGVIASSIASDP